MELVQLLKRIRAFMRKFNIYNITQKRNEDGVCASSPEELHSLYNMSDEKIRILSEVPNDVELTTVPIVEDNGDGSVTIIDTKVVAVPSVPIQETSQLIPPHHPLDLKTGLPLDIKTSPGISIVEPPPSLTPKFFTDNGTEFKTVGGKLYKKTWVNVNMDYYRIISDKTNKIVNLTGKTIQTLDWVEIKGE